MKKLNEYLTASAKQYNYRIKVAGDFPKEIYDKFKAALGMFDVESCTAPKKTPIQDEPLGFPGLKNEEVSIFDTILNYPANSGQIIELARVAGINPAKIIVIDKDFDESMNKEAEAAKAETRLETPEYPEQSKEQKEAGDAYADSYETAAREFAGTSNTKFEIAGDESTTAKYSTDDDNGKDSPLSKVKRQNIKDMAK